jgi:hypothetical protein
VRAFRDALDAKGDRGPNGVPDVLDQARRSLEWMLKMHPALDALYHQVGDNHDHLGLRLPQNETTDDGWGLGTGRAVYHNDFGNDATNATSRPWTTRPRPS